MKEILNSYLAYIQEFRSRQSIVLSTMETMWLEVYGTKYPKTNCVPCIKTQLTQLEGAIHDKLSKLESKKSKKK